MDAPAARPHRLHAFDVSYFSAKVRTALRYKGVWFDEVRADLREIARRTGLGFVPVVVTPEDETWQDSTDIFDRLEARHPEPPLFPSSPVQRIAAHLVELYTDEFATIPAMHYRWGSALGEATARARFIAMIGDERAGNAAADRMAAARLALGATDALAAEIEAHTRDLLDALSSHLAESPYLLGERMSFADCALMGPVHAHLFNDLVSRRMLLESAVPVVGWIERCNAPDPVAQASRSLGDGVDAGLLRILAVMGRDAADVILDGVRAFEAWADERPPDLETPPRTIGRMTTRLRGRSFERVAGPYTAWMLQRTVDARAALPASERERVDVLLAGTGWEAVLAHVPRHRLTKRGFDLVFAEDRAPAIGSHAAGLDGSTSTRT